MAGQLMGCRTPEVTQGALIVSTIRQLKLGTSNAYPQLLIAAALNMP
jgi:hypothetical protein